MKTPMQKEKERCPRCNHVLYERYEGLVCKNWKCDFYHKLGRGWVLMTKDSDWSLNRSRINGLYSKNTRLLLQNKWAEKKTQILVRDDYVCQICGYSLADDFYHETGLIVHHIIPASVEMAMYFDDDNLTTLCTQCHNEIHRNDKNSFSKR